MAKSKKAFWIGGAVVLVIIIAVVVVLTVRPGSAKKIELVRIGSTAPGHLKFILFQQLGLLEKEFEKDGIEFEFYPFVGGGSPAVTALATGGVDIVYTGADPALRVSASGADVYLIGLSSFDRGGGTSSIAVEVNSPIQTVADLRGKKIAFLTGTMRHNLLTRALKLEGISLDDIEGTNLSFDASGPALLRGDVDAVVEGTSTLAPLLSTGSIRLILDGEQINRPEWSFPSVISANGEFVRNNPDVVKRILRVDYELSNWVDKHYDETIAAFAKGTDQSIDAIKKNYKDRKFYQGPILSQEALQALRDEEAFLLEAGLSNGVIDYDKWVQGGYLDAAIKEANLN
jgi:aliphatic sulfonates family ABC transporter substrate-binding protein